MSVPIDIVLYRLLHDRAYRRALVSGRVEALDLTPDDREALDAIDHDELEAMAARICRTLLRGDLEQEGGLARAYPGVLAELARCGREPMAAVYSFVESGQYRRVRHLPYGEPGLCAEEAFFNFMSADTAFVGARVGNSSLLRHEFLSAIMAMLTVNRDPSFAVESELVHFNGVAHYAMGEGTDETRAAFLYAATASRFLRGETAPAVVEIVALGSSAAALERAPALARRFDVTEARIHANVRATAAMGLIR